MTPDKRWKQRFENYRRALTVLAGNCAQEEYSDLERSGLIQNFEVAFELAWKVLKDYLEHGGERAFGPREALRLAFQAEIINDDRGWMEILDSRNEFAHSYDEVKATNAVRLIKSRYLRLLQLLEIEMGRRAGP